MALVKKDGKRIWVRSQDGVLAFAVIEELLRDLRLTVVSRATGVSYPTVVKLGDGDRDANYTRKTLLKVSKYLMHRLKFQRRREKADREITALESHVEPKKERRSWASGQRIFRLEDRHDQSAARMRNPDPDMAYVDRRRGDVDALGQYDRRNGPSHDGFLLEVMDDVVVDDDVDDMDDSEL